MANIDDRIEALTQTVELLSHMHRLKAAHNWMKITGNLVPDTMEEHNANN